jgi:hypothetical protein
VQGVDGDFSTSFKRATYREDAFNFSLFVVVELESLRFPANNFFTAIYGDSNHIAVTLFSALVAGRMLFIEFIFIEKGVALVI